MMIYRGFDHFQHNSYDFDDYRASQDDFGLIEEVLQRIELKKLMSVQNVKAFR